MPLLFLLLLIIIIFIKKNPGIGKLFIITFLAHLLLIAAIYIHKYPYIKSITNDGEVFSMQAGNMATVITGKKYNRWDAKKKFGHEGYFYRDFSKGKIPRMSEYGVGFNTYLYTAIYSAYGYWPVYIHIFNILINFLTGTIIFNICKMLFNHKTAVIALILFLFSPVSFYYSTTMAKETLYVFAFYWSIYLAILSVKRRNIGYFLLVILPLLIIYFIRQRFIYPILLILVIYFFISLLSKKKLLFIIAPILSIAFLLNFNFIHMKLWGYVGTATYFHNAYQHSGGNNYNIMIFGSDIPQYNTLEQIIHVLNAWYHFISEPILLNNITITLMALYLFKIIFVFLFILGVFGVLSCFRSNNQFIRENILLLSFFFVFGSILALASGNIGTMLRHRDLITPVVFIYASYFISKIGLKKNIICNKQSLVEKIFSV